ncbi:unnamed protein product, partial [Owenia fusiformis]
LFYNDWKKNIYDIDWKPDDSDIWKFVSVDVNLKGIHDEKCFKITMFLSTGTIQVQGARASLFKTDFPMLLSMDIEEGITEQDDTILVENEHEDDISFQSTEMTRNVTNTNTTNQDRIIKRHTRKKLDDIPAMAFSPMLIRNKSKTDHIIQEKESATDGKKNTGDKNECIKEIPELMNGAKESYHCVSPKGKLTDVERVISNLQTSLVELSLALNEIKDENITLKQNNDMFQEEQREMMSSLKSAVKLETQRRHNQIETLEHKFNKFTDECNKRISVNTSESQKTTARISKLEIQVQQMQMLEAAKSADMQTRVENDNIKENKTESVKGLKTKAEINELKAKMPNHQDEHIECGANCDMKENKSVHDNAEFMKLKAKQRMKN